MPTNDKQADQPKAIPRQTHGIGLLFLSILAVVAFCFGLAIFASIASLIGGNAGQAEGIIFLTEGGFVGFLVVTVLCLTASVLAKSGLLAAMSVLSLSATAGAMTAYGHATYMLAIRQPTVTVCLFGLLSLGTYYGSKLLPLDYQRLAIVFARTSLFVVNLGFWIGSLWGDSLWHQRDIWISGSGEVIPDWVFGTGWAVGLVVTGIWAAWSNKRWVVNLLAVFGAIHFYTQYFAWIGPSPGSILTAGLVALGIALAIVRYNKFAKAAATENGSRRTHRFRIQRDPKSSNERCIHEPDKVKDYVDIINAGNLPAVLEPTPVPIRPLKVRRRLALLLLALPFLGVGCVEGNVQDFIRYEPKDDTFWFLQLYTNLVAPEKEDQEHLASLWKRRNALLIVPLQGELGPSLLMQSALERTGKNQFHAIDLAKDSGNERRTEVCPFDLDAVRSRAGPILHQ